jgi:Calcineurin-like phosphoesterase
VLSTTDISAALTCWPAAVGDIHGDINKVMSCLEMADVASFQGGVPKWTGGDTIVVQLGDILDRGDAEIASLMLLRQLGRQAERDGGAIHILNGNHESLNVCGDFRCATLATSCAHTCIANILAAASACVHLCACKLHTCRESSLLARIFCLIPRFWYGAILSLLVVTVSMRWRYVTSGAFTESGMIMGLSGAQLQDLEMLVRARLALYTPGQPMALELSKNPTVLVVNDTVFAHGGLLPEHVDYGIEKINAEVAAWMRADEEADGSHAPPPFIALGCDSII